MKRLLGLTLLATLIIVGASGCIKVQKQKITTTNTLGGVFFTEDRFETWKHRSTMMTPGEVAGSIGGVDVAFMRFDPSDSEAMYLGTRADGVYYTYNGGAGWTKAEKLPVGFVRDLAVDPKDKCTIYVAVENKIFRSEDCSRNWAEVYYTDKPDVKVTALEIDWFESVVVYAGLSDGSLLRSKDRGIAWTLSKKFLARIAKIAVDPNDSRNVYVGITDNGLAKTVDKGETWTELNKAMKDFSGAKKYYDLAIATSAKNVILYANKFGVLRSLDGGTTWSEVKLLTPPGSEQIYALAVDPKNADYIYYSTNSAIYKTVDGGANWVVKKTPTTRVVSEILVHPKTVTRIFAGVKTIEQ
ncbi:hypothetical protein A2482_03530 [Candidatus Falkowbacteria bacterium RIFOXYC2_FULL_48_21]|uniref:Photosynthesis system II assembly factor Ycf48/Hcf136-like domain-containing protein n=1 Tax=Candidatus Falkowbacteria bacterium RIFOXYC2_FULL_48_21 TaxID=1798005 RepID=A0A1F5T9L6_9BACT|nr:MAG: hypothetical protein A2482_03530 [Candidatus Falkowbacteria bacterium RIFOXYC2_FULL_48_21]